MANLFTRISQLLRNVATDMPPADFLKGVEVMDIPEVNGKHVNSETSRNIATAYRCINILSDDVAKLPLQSFVSRTSGQIDRISPSSRLENIAWLLEISPNRWMTPFVFKKLIIQWLVTRGAAYIWQPPIRAGRRRELFILPSNVTQPLFDTNFQLWYEVAMPGWEVVRYPDTEVLALLINSEDGVTGRGVIAYARDTLGRQLANYATQNKIAGKGLNPSGIAWMAGDLDKEARKKVRQTYEEALRESGIAIFDPKVTKFEAITLKPVDAQFLESIQENDTEIANFFGVPLYKLNQGKQSYQSNEQQNLDYLNTTLDPYLVQWEQAAAIKWLTEEEQNYSYFRFNRDALLRTDAKTRSETLEKRIFSGQLTPNEARQIEDMPAYQGGDKFYVPANMQSVATTSTTRNAGGNEDGNNGSN
jgi:HK97 family phage portal protein